MHWHGPEMFVVRVDGDSMEPHFRDGDYVHVDPDESAVDGCFVGVRDGGGSGVRIRWFGLEDGRRVICTLNPFRIECTLDGHNETMIQGVAVMVGNAV